MPLEVILPKVDMDMATGKISKWLVQDGDVVKKGAILFELETDKAAMEVDSPGDGVIRNIVAGNGAVVPVGSPVAYIYGPDEPISVPHQIVPAKLNVPVPAAHSIASSFRNEASSDKTRATPLARRLAREAGISLEGRIGSGPRGRIVASDIAKFGASATTMDSAPATSSGPALDNTKNIYPPGSFDILPIDGMRRTIASRLTLSKQTIPHFYLNVTCDLETLLGVREKLNARAPLGTDKRPLWKLSINDFTIKALALALRQVPRANVTWTDDGILQHNVSDVGVAVAVEGGLFTPIVRTAEAKTLSQISREMKDLAGRARARKLLPSEYQGGTTAISNLGMFGIEQFTAIINPPHATILAIGAAVERFVPVDGRPVLRTQMTATLSCDHRVVDGAAAAQLLAAFRSIVEEPALMLA